MDTILDRIALTNLISARSLCYISPEEKKRIDKEIQSIAQTYRKETGKYAKTLHQLQGQIREVEHRLFMESQANNAKGNYEEDKEKERLFNEQLNEEQEQDNLRRKNEWEKE